MDVDLERGRFGDREDVDALRGDLDLAGRELGVDGALRTRSDRSLDADAVLVAKLLSSLVSFFRHAGIEYDLNQTCGVAQIDERDAAVIAACVNPSAKRDRLSVVLAAEVAAAMGSHHDRNSSSNASSAIDRCSWLERSLTVAWRDASSASPRMTAQRAPDRSA